jgi:hypothetical protein
MMTGLFLLAGTALCLAWADRRNVMRVTPKTAPDSQHITMSANKSRKLKRLRRKPEGLHKRQKRNETKN